MTWIAVQFARYQHKARMRALGDGVRCLGGTVVDLKDCTAAVDLIALVKQHKPRFAFTCGMHHVDSANRGILAGLGVPLLVLDCGYFQRSDGANDEEGFNQLGLGCLNWVPPSHLNSLRNFNSRWEAHGIALAPRVQGRSKVALVLGQVPGDSQHHLSEQRLAAWLTEKAAQLYAQGYIIFYRPHPKHVLTKIHVPHHVVQPQDESLAQALSRASVAVAYNSTAGLEALIAGVPVICAPSAHYAGLAPDSGDLLSHVWRLAWTQWTCAELRTGEPLKFMHRVATDLLPEEVAS